MRAAGCPGTRRASCPSRRPDSGVAATESSALRNTWGGSPGKVTAKASCRPSGETASVDIHSNRAFGGRATCSWTGRGFAGVVPQAHDAEPRRRGEQQGADHGDRRPAARRLRAMRPVPGARPRPGRASAPVPIASVRPGPWPGRSARPPRARAASPAGAPRSGVGSRSRIAAATAAALCPSKARWPVSIS